MTEPNPERRRRGRGVNVVPSRVRLAREEAGLTLSQVADGKLSRTAIHLIETGRSRPSQETLAHISSRTGKPTAYFTGVDFETEDVDVGLATRRVVDGLRQTSWSLARLLRANDLGRTQRVALEGLLTVLRQGMRLVEAIGGDLPR